MEAILQQILEGQLETTKELKRLSDGQNKLFEGQAQITQKLDTIDNRLDNIDSKLAENTRFIHALSQDVARTATKEDVSKIYSRIEVLSIHFMNQEAEIRELKLAK